MDPWYEPYPHITEEHDPNMVECPECGEEVFDYLCNNDAGTIMCLACVQGAVDSDAADRGHDQQLAREIW